MLTNLLAWFVTADLTTWDTAVQNVTDGLKVCVIDESLIILTISNIMVRSSISPKSSSLPVYAYREWLSSSCASASSLGTDTKSSPIRPWHSSSFSQSFLFSCVYFNVHQSTFHGTVGHKAQRTAGVSTSRFFHMWQLDSTLHLMPLFL